MQGSFLNDAQLLSIMVRLYKLAKVTKRNNKLNRLNSVSFASNAFLNIVQSVKSDNRNYNRYRRTFLLKRHSSAAFSLRLFSTFFSLGKLHMRYKSGVVPIVNKCMRSIRIAEFTNVGNSVKFDSKSGYD